MRAADISRQLAEEGFGSLTLEEAGSFELYLQQLMKWKQKISLTSIKSEAEIVSRHLGESLVCARSLPPRTGTLLDFGTGAGLPGIPCAICNPWLQVTLADAQAKKIAFLQEVRRTLDGRFAIHHGRVEALPRAVRFDVVTLRAVERMERSCQLALKQLNDHGSLVLLTSRNALISIRDELKGTFWHEPLPMPNSAQRILIRAEKNR